MLNRMVLIVIICIVCAIFIWYSMQHNSLPQKQTEKVQTNVPIHNDVLQGAHQFTLPLDSGRELPLINLQDHVILFVNTAAKCGFASQYKNLEELYQKYKNHNFIIIGVSSDDFHQEIKNDEERVCYLEDNFPTTFPLTQTLHVTGENAHPLYKWLNAQAGLLGKVKWNFHKFLVGKDGQFIDWFAPTTNPTNKKIIDAIEKAL